MTVHYEQERVSITHHPDFRTIRDEWGGRSMQDFWDWEAGAFRRNAPSKLRGITQFWRSVKRMDTADFPELFPLLDSFLRQHYEAGTISSWRAHPGDDDAKGLALSLTYGIRRIVLEAADESDMIAQVRAWVASAAH